MNVMRMACALLSPAGKNGKLSVFIFHRVFSETDPLFPDEPDAKRFDEILGWINTWFNVLPLDEALAKLNNKTLPKCAAAITFDDGYADNRAVALPILLKHRITATFFIATGFLDGGRMWNDTIIESVRACSSSMLDLKTIGLEEYPVGSIQEKKEAIAAIIPKVKYRSISERIDLSNRIAALAGADLGTDLMMSSQQVKELREAGMQIGAHTVSHPILASLVDGDARKEISDSKSFLESLLGEHIGLFAYPNGKPGVDYSPEHVSLVRELGFDAAVSTSIGCAKSSADPYQIPRFTPWDTKKTRFALRLIQNYLRAV